MSSTDVHRSRPRSLTGLALVLALAPVAASGEGSSDITAPHTVRALTPLHVDVLDHTQETIDWTGGGFIDLYDPTGVLVATLNSGDSYAPLVDGTFDVSLSQDESTWDLAITSPAMPVGRVWSEHWNLQGAGFGDADALSMVLYAVVPGGVAGDNVIAVDIDGMAGIDGDILANSAGIDGAHGRSVPVAGMWANPEYPLYLNPPEDADYLYDLPSLGGVSFGAGPLACDVISPGDVPGTFGYTAGGPAFVHLVCDSDFDGLFEPASSDDVHRFGAVAGGTEVLEWDGLDNDGSALAPGTYSCRLQLTASDVHVIVGDAETLYEGLRLFWIDATATAHSLAMYWDDVEVQGLAVTMPNGQVGSMTSGATGVESGDPLQPADPNTNAHSWGAFGFTGKGNNAFVDTYAWVDEQVGPTLSVDVVGWEDTDSDNLSDAMERCWIGSSPTNADSDGDGCADDLEVGADPTQPPDGDFDGLIDVLDLDSHDSDSDGYSTCAGDCNDTDATIHPAATEICDGRDNDCDGSMGGDEIDADGDGFLVCDGDCDDTNTTTYPGAPEICDGADNDCDGTTPVDEADWDGDGYGTCAGDCDDLVAGTYPGAAEVCDGADNDCDGSLPPDEADADGDGHAACAECDDTDADSYPGATEICDGADNDCDGATPADETDADGDGHLACGECDDADAGSYPGAPEACDGVDTDCDGALPDDEADADGDGWRGCEGDCDDTAADTHPAADEICDDGADNDCDGDTDGDDPDCATGDDDDATGDDDDSAGDDDDATGDDDDDTWCGQDEGRVPGFGEFVGGCRCQGTPSSPPFGGAALGLVLALIVAARRRRPRAGSPRSMAPFAAVALLLGHAGDAQAAPEFDAQLFHPNGNQLGFVATESARSLDLGETSFGVWAVFAKNPVVHLWEGDVEGLVVRDLMTVYLHGALGFRHADLSVVVPLNALVAGEGLAAYGCDYESSYSGDVRVIPRVTLLDSQDHGFGLGLVLPVLLPSGLPGQYGGHPTVAGEPTLAFERESEKARLGVNVGLKLQAEQTLGNLSRGRAFLFRVGGDLRPHQRLTLRGEVVGLVHSTDDVPVEWRAGVIAWPLKWLGFQLFGGTALGHGVGSPEVRVMGSVMFWPPKLPIGEQPEPEEVVPEEPAVEAPAEPAAPPPPPPPADEDGDGVLDPDDACPGEPEIFNGVTDEDGCPDQVQARVDRVKKEIVIDDQVHFELNRAIIDESSVGLLDSVARILLDHPDIQRLEIQGHTDTQGAEASNQRLSANRAAAVRDHLISRGIAAERLQAVGYGESQPLDPSNTAGAHAINRRVQFVILQQD